MVKVTLTAAVQSWAAFMQDVFLRLVNAVISITNLWPDPARFWVPIKGFNPVLRTAPADLWAHMEFHYPQQGSTQMQESSHMVLRVGSELELRVLSTTLDWARVDWQGARLVFRGIFHFSKPRGAPAEWHEGHSKVVFLKYFEKKNSFKMNNIVPTPQLHGFPYVMTNTEMHPLRVLKNIRMNE